MPIVNVWFRPNEHGLHDEPQARAAISKQLYQASRDKPVKAHIHLNGYKSTWPHEWTINLLAKWRLSRPLATLDFYSDDPLVAEAWEQALAHEVKAIKQARRASHALAK